MWRIILLFLRKMMLKINPLYNFVVSELIFVVTLWIRRLKGVIMLKRLAKHGNSRAIVVDKAILEAAGIPEDALFQISVNPSGGLVIQSVLDVKLDEFREKFKELNREHKKLMQNLADM